MRAEIRDGEDLGEGVGCVGCVHGRDLPRVDTREGDVLPTSVAWCIQDGKRISYYVCHVCAYSAYCPYSLVTLQAKSFFSAITICHR
jgi:hypothetical protein